MFPWQTKRMFVFVGFIGASILDYRLFYAAAVLKNNNKKGNPKTLKRVGKTKNLKFNESLSFIEDLEIKNKA